MRVRIGKEPKDDGHHQHRHRVDGRHRAPAQSDDDQRRGKDVDGGTRVTRAENTQHHALSLFLKPRRGVGDTDGERAAGQADTKTNRKVLPILVGEGQPIGGHGDQNHLNEIDDASAIPVGEQSKGQARQGTCEDRCGYEEAERGFVETQFILDLDADYREHGPHREVDGEGHSVHNEDGILFPRI